MMRESMATDEAEKTVELYVRSLTPDDGRGPQSAVIDTLSRLEDEGRIDELTVSVWGRIVGLSTTARRTDEGQAILDTIAAFRAWARATGRSLNPAFTTRETTARITGESHASILLPTMVLAEYHDGELHHVTPHQQNGAVTTVADRVNTLTTVRTTSPLLVEQ